MAVHFAVGLKLGIVGLFEISWRTDEQEEREREGAGTGGGEGASVNCWTLCFPCNLLLIAKDIAFCCSSDAIFLLTGLRIYTGEYKAQGPTLCPTEGRALRGPRALYSPV